MKSQKCDWKNFIDLGKLYSYIQFHMGYQIIFCRWVEKVEKKYQTGEKIKFLPVKLDFYPWKKTKRVSVKKKEGVKKTEKSVRENIVLPVKPMFFGDFGFFHGQNDVFTHTFLCFFHAHFFFTRALVWFFFTGKNLVSRTEI